MKTRSGQRKIRPLRSGYSLLVVQFLGVGFLAGCAGFSAAPELSPTSPAEASSPIPAEPTDTQVSLNLETVTPTSIQILTPTPSPFPATPDFSAVPDPGRDFKAWRPPVYPVPWVPSPYDHFYFTNPIAAFDIDPAYSTYSYGDVFFEDVVHTGIDIPGDIGTPILAAGDGQVIYASMGAYRGGNNVYDDPYGKAVIIEHSFGYQGQPLFTLYAHLDQILVKKGQTVRAGDRIGLMGRTGKTTGPHLHFEVRLGENDYFATRNPDLWISPPQGWGVLVGQILTYEGRLLEKQLVYLYRSQDDLRGDELDELLWIGKSYQNQAINFDPYYKENLTISNIPAGSYYVSIPVTEIGFAYQEKIEIKPGQVTFIKFHVWKGFTDLLPPTPEVIFSPSP